MQTILVPTAVGPSSDIAADITAIRKRLAEGQRFIRLKQSKAAAVVLWSALESAVRLSLTELGQQTGNPIQVSDTALGLSAQAVAYGVIDPEDREVLRLLPMRNAAVHSGSPLIDEKLLQKVSKFTEQTLDEMQQ